MILEIELSKYKRLSLNNIRYFKLTLKEIVQIILGTNGSGKSAILFEMTPLPANHKNYYKGGKKRILMTHQGKVYELISDFNEGQNHYFWVDGVNLNIGRTVTVQKELVKEHFNTTTETHELMLGEELFTKMSPSRRRELFMQLCIVDYTYAIKLYKKIQGELHATSGALKRAKERLVQETIMTLNDAEVSVMRDRLSILNKESQSMYLLRNASASTVVIAKTTAQAAINTINELKNRFSGVRKLLLDKCYIAPEEYQLDIDTTRDELAGVQSVYARLSDEFIKTSVEINSISEVEGEDATKLKDSVIANNQQATMLLERRKQPLEGFKPLAASQSMELVYESLLGVLTQIPSDPDGKMNSTALNETNEKLRLLSLSLLAYKEKLGAMEHREKHLTDLSSADKVTCPECTHEWKIGYSVETHEQLKQRIEQGRKAIEVINKDIADHTEHQNKLSQYADHYKEYVRITRNTPELQPLWDLIVEHDSLRQSPQHAMTLIDLVRGDLFIEMQVSAIRDKIKTDMQKLKLVEYAQSASVKEKKIRQEQLETELGILSARKVAVQQRLQELLIEQRQIKQMYDIGDKMFQAKEAFTTASYAVIESIKNEIIDESLIETHNEIATLSTRIHSIDRHAALVDDIKSSILKHEAEEKAYKALADTLSPVDGLIAEGMLGFIRSYVSRMNALIAKIWTYRMVVHDCSTESETAELNYKFPLSTPNLPEPVPDVNNGSAGQREMIDLAFRIISAQCLGLDRGPLFLDEFGKTFDESHQAAATQVIRQLMEQLNFSQLFMISHYESCYGAFYNAQVSVIDKRNITVPGGRRYNEFVEMTT